MKLKAGALLNKSLTYTVCLVVLSFLVYSNNYHHEYHLDSNHLIPDNPTVRNLKNIPDFFTDPGTFSVLPSNVDYRPILQCSYALNYRISAYETWSWHLVQILLHAVCSVSLYFFILVIIRQFYDDTRTKIKLVAFIIAGLFTIHPTGSGVVNYLSARSSLLTAAFLLPSFLCYMKPWEDRRYKGVQVSSLLLFNLALFTKVEAVGALPVFFLYDLLQTARKRISEGGENGHFLRDLYSTLNSTVLRRCMPMVISAGGYFILRALVMSGFDHTARYSDGMTPGIYLLTQTTAWWYYVRNWFVPVNLVSDTMAYPIFRTISDPHVLLALGGWMLVLTIVCRYYAKHPWLLFVVGSSFSLIAPTSTVAPLSEMVNEHRPYLPLAVFSIAWMFPLLKTIFIGKKRKGWHLFTGVLSLLLVATSFYMLTRQRNLVFSTEERFCQDNLIKAPSARAYANYGLQFMKKKEYEKARYYYDKSVALAPNYYIAHINLGIIEQYAGDYTAALMHFDKAVENDRYSATALIYRAEHYLARSEFRKALEDFETVLPLHNDRYRICKGAATAASGLGNREKAIQYLKSCFAENPKLTEHSIVAISKPYWNRKENCNAGLYFYEVVDSLFPDRWWVHQNMADLARLCNDAKRMECEALLAREMKKNAGISQ